MATRKSDMLECKPEAMRQVLELGLTITQVGRVLGGPELSRCAVPLGAPAAKLRAALIAELDASDR